MQTEDVINARRSGARADESYGGWVGRSVGFDGQVER